jgi:hypothetical protein
VQLLTRTLSRANLLPPAGAVWPPAPRRLWLASPETVAVIRAAEPPAPCWTLELAGLPRPDGGSLVVLIERLPFHRSPGRWHCAARAAAGLRVCWSTSTTRVRERALLPA